MIIEKKKVKTKRINKRNFFYYGMHGNDRKKKEKNKKVYEKKVNKD
jgi:hypothetical protein